MDFMLMPLKRYAEFTGRSRRKEFWMFFLLIFSVMIGLSIIGYIASQIAGILGLLVSGVQLIVWLALLIPYIACGIRRMHDQDKSGLFLLLVFIPVIGGLILLFFMVQEGTRGSNQYGPDPKAGE